MDRRALLAAGAIAMAARPVFAQSDNRTNARTSALGDAEKTHAEKTATIGTASLAMANLALEWAHGEKSGSSRNSRKTSRSLWLGS